MHGFIRIDIHFIFSVVTFYNYIHKFELYTSIWKLIKPSQKLTRYVKLHLSRVFSMNIADNNLVFALIIGLDFLHAKGDETIFAICDELETTTFDNLCDALVKLESRCRVTLHLNCEVTSLIWREKRFCYF